MAAESTSFGVAWTAEARAAQEDDHARRSVSLRPAARGRYQAEENRLPRAARSLSGARRQVRRRPERGRGARLRPGAHAGARRRPRAGPAAGLGPAARRAHDHQGVVRRARPADDVGRAGLQGPGRDEERRCRRSLARRGRGPFRQDERAALSRRLAELQRDLRHHEQPVGRQARARRILRRLRGGAGGGAHRPGSRQRHRLVDPQPGALLRRVRPQADVGYRPARGSGSPLANRAGRHRRGGPAGAQRRRSRRRAGGHGRPRRDRRGRLAATACAAAAEAAARLQGGLDARRPGNSPSTPR